jgi:hypothetical protein
MIGLRIMGGLCNMMFIIATGETWRVRGHDIHYTNMDFNLDFFNKHHIPVRHTWEYKDVFSNFNWDEFSISSNASLKEFRPPFEYADIVPQHGYEYVGYFQSEKNFPDKQFIEWLFTPSDKIKERLYRYEHLFSGVTCSIHVRRSDYITSAKNHPVLDMDYYNKAIQTLKPFHVNNFIVFSDDMEWCRANFIGDNFIFIDDKEYVLLYLMGKCTHNIIANSSFSWWGAWLPEQNNRIVIAPDIWIGNIGKNTKDIVPQRWIRL